MRNSVRVEPVISTLHGLSCKCLSSNITHYEFSDVSSEVELRLQLGGKDDVGSVVTLIDTNTLFEKIMPAEAIWLVALRSESAGSMQLLKGTSIYIVRDSTKINQKVARELAVAFGHVGWSLESHGAAGRTDKGGILIQGLVFGSQTEEALDADEDLVEEEVRKHFQVEEPLYKVRMSRGLAKHQPTGWDLSTATDVPPPATLSN
ncbi:hypothetical protein F3Y22_tig00110816pilonHSYRG00086 [Hibiscus syriacus]|uniref:Uncharacterized protein n=1 Tax=Hibiscus syriacus TaxID=106335 RepID=A0A6A2ZMG5_HIBSY|nr:hypothetical protein F3Y22_tig00110816pilonHSYRG00086 [Hibiscus syriacus]